MRNDIAMICRELEFPQEAVQAMLTAWDAIAASTAARSCWEKWAARYGQDINIDFAAALREVDEAAQCAGVAQYTAELVFFLSLAPQMKKEYEKRDLDLRIWHDSCMDLYWKMMKCRRIYGIWGSFVGTWFAGFFQLTRFTLGRLEFELIDFPEDYEKAGRHRPAGMEKAINVHIPAAGKLERRQCRDAYQKAAAFFADAFHGNALAFVCESWMLFPEHRRMLDENSGIVQFMSDYDIYKTWESDGDLWRIFYREDCSNPSTLPCDTRLQRAYRELLLSGGHPGMGEGIFFLARNTEKEVSE